MPRAAPIWLLEIVVCPWRWAASSCLRYRLTRTTTALGASFSVEGSRRGSLTGNAPGADLGHLRVVAVSIQATARPTVRSRSIGPERRPPGLREDPRQPHVVVDPHHLNILQHRGFRHTGGTPPPDRTEAVRAPFDPGPEVDLDLIDLPRVEERAVEPAAALDQDVRHPTPSQRVEQVAGSDPARVGREDEHLAPRVHQGRAPAGVGFLGRDDQDRDLPRRPDQAAVGRDPGQAIDDDAQGGAGAGRPGGQLGVVVLDRAQSDDDRIHLAAPLVDDRPGTRPADPLAIAAGRGGLAVPGHRPLGDDVGPPCGHSLEEWPVEPGGPRLLDPDLDLDPGLAEPGEAAAVDPGERVAHRGDDADHPGGDQGIGARRGLAEVATGFQGDEGRGTSGGLARERQRMDLGMRAAELLMVTERDGDPIPDQHAADHRVGFDRPFTPTGLGEGEAHPRRVFDRVGGHAGAQKWAGLDVGPGFAAGATFFAGSAAFEGSAFASAISVPAG